MNDLTATSTADDSAEEQEYARLVRTLRGRTEIDFKNAQMELQCMSCGQRTWQAIPQIDMRTVMECTNCKDGVRTITRRFKVPSLATGKPNSREVPTQAIPYRLSFEK